MAPEVVRRKQTDLRLDVFAYGVSMYEMFTFELPWQRGAGDGLAAMSHGQSEPIPMQKHRPRINPKIAEIVLKCLRPSPAERYPSMRDVLANLVPILSEEID
jgi:serine/threonine-protein kinase